MTLTVQTDADSRRLRPARARGPTTRTAPAPSLAVARAARPTSRPARCSTASARSTGCPSARAWPPSAARSCTRCSSGCTTSRPPSAPSRPRRSCWSRPGPSCARSPASPSCSPSRRTTAPRPTPSAPESVEAWLASAGKLVEKYFTLEDPTRIQPHGREELVEVTLPDGLLLRGFVDRLDVAPNGALRVVDYKTGAVPREAFEGKALFQMKFYALVLWRTRGVVAAQLKLLYLKDGDALTYAPDEDELVRFERTLMAIWAAIERAVATGDFRPNQTRLCDWCDHQALCPAFGGTPPPFPAEAAAAAGWQTLPDRRARTESATPPRRRRRVGPWRLGLTSSPTCTATGHRGLRRRARSCPAALWCSSTTAASSASSRQRPRAGRLHGHRAADATLLPGLIDAHVHLCGDSSPRALDQLPELDDDELDAIVGASMSAARWPAGVTAVRDLGDARWAVLDRHRGGDTGPTVVASGPPITSPGGHCAGMGGEARESTALRRAVRERAERGVDVVKIMTSGGSDDPSTDVLAGQFTLDELRVVVDEAHRLGLPVTAHAHGLPAVELCVAAGVDGDRALHLRDRRRASAWTGAGRRDRGRRHRRLPDPRRRPGVDAAPHIQAVARARAHDVEDQLSADRRHCTAPASPWSPASTPASTRASRTGSCPMAVVELVDCGLPTTEALAAATGVAARACGLAARAPAGWRRAWTPTCCWSTATRLADITALQRRCAWSCPAAGEVIRPAGRRSRQGRSASSGLGASTSASSGTPTPTSPSRSVRPGAGSTDCIAGTPSTATPGGQPGGDAGLRVLDHDALGRRPRPAPPSPAGTAPGRACGPAPRRRRSVTSNGSAPEVVADRRASTMSASRRGVVVTSGGRQAGGPDLAQQLGRAGAPGDAARHQLRRPVLDPAARRRAAAPRCGVRPRSACRMLHRHPHARADGRAARASSDIRPPSRRGELEHRLAPVLLGLHQRAVHVEQDGAQAAPRRSPVVHVDVVHVVGRRAAAVLHRRPGAVRRGEHPLLVDEVLHAELVPVGDVVRDDRAPEPVLDSTM